MRTPSKWILLVVVLIALASPVAWRALFPPPSRSLEGVRLVDVEHRVVHFRNTVQDIPLAGMLLLPQGQGPFPAVVVIQGSGTSVRDNAWYLTLASHLRARGIAVLVPDKRGSVESGGDWRSASMQDLATDTQAALDWLRRNSGVPLSRVGVAGMSQGGWVAPIIASRPGNVDFVVSLVASTVPAVDALVYEENHNLRQMGFLPGFSNLVAAISTRVVRHGSQKPFWSANGDFDPLPYWRRVEVPALLLYGAADTNTPTAASVARLRTLGLSNLRTGIYSGSAHALEDPPGRGNHILRREALEEITDFVRGAERRQETEKSETE
jgi:dipeptidyl aminopeptidase/acylaminoacyl peptidase